MSEWLAQMFARSVIVVLRPTPFIAGYRRRQIEAIRNGSGLTKGRSVLREHMVTDVFTFMAICGAPVQSCGGRFEEADCRACWRTARRAVDGLRRRRSDDACEGDHGGGK